MLKFIPKPTLWVPLDPTNPLNQLNRQVQRHCFRPLLSCHSHYYHNLKMTKASRFIWCQWIYQFTCMIISLVQKQIQINTWIILFLVTSPASISKVCASPVSTCPWNAIHITPGGVLHRISLIIVDMWICTRSMNNRLLCRSLRYQRILGLMMITLSQNWIVADFPSNNGRTLHS